MGVKIRQKDGKWYVFINHKGTRKAKCIGDSKRAAEEVKRKLEAKLTLGEFALQEKTPQALTFGQYAEEWLATYAQLNCKPSTYRRYAGVVRNHLLPALGTLRLTDLHRETIKRLLLTHRATLTPSSVRQILAPLREMLNHAVEDGLLGSNPASRVGRVLAPRRQGAREIHPLTREELAVFLDTLQTHAPAYYPFFLCLARTGMRLGEALALQWGDIDWQGRFVDVRRSYTLGKITTPKNGKSRRVDLSRHLTEVLRHLLTQRKAETLQHGRGQLPVWVFCSQTGGLLDPDNVRSRVFYRCLAQAGLRQVRIHDLRHTYASLLLQQGESIAYIRDQLGHHSIQVTVDIYGHLVPGGNHAAVDRLDDTPTCNARATARQAGNA
jgi:integrase